MPPPLLYRMDPGPMPVRIAHPLSGAETALERAFTYTETSQVRMVLETIERARRAYDGYRGRFSLSVDLGEVAVESAAFFIQCSPRLMGMTAEFEPAPALVETGRTLSLKSYGGGQYRAELSAGDPIAGHLALGTLRWRLAQVPAPVEALNWIVYVPDFRVPWGGGVKVSANELTEDLRGALAEPPPNPAPASP
jgi:hypothetical protein